MEKIKVQRIMETTYEDGTYWIEYLVNDKKLGYEISEEIEEDIVKELQNWIYNKKFNSEQLTKKKDIEECSSCLAEIIEQCRQSENEIWFIEEDEITEEEVKKLEDEVNKLGIEDYVTFYEDGCVITVYGGIITQFLF